MGPGEVEAGEEDVVGGLEAGERGYEDVFWGEMWQGGKEGDEARDEEDEERLGDGAGH